MCQLDLVMAVSMLLLCASSSVIAQCMEDMEGATEGMNVQMNITFWGEEGGGRKGSIMP